LLVKHSPSTEFLSKALQMLPIEHGEKSSIPGVVDGFMMNLPPASQALAE
jgi:hypothetical protein